MTVAGRWPARRWPTSAVTEAAAGLAVPRPLLAFDKREILHEARRIGADEIAALPHQDCGQLFQPRRVAHTHDRRQTRSHRGACGSGRIGR